MRESQRSYGGHRQPARMSLKKQDTHGDKMNRRRMTRIVVGLLPWWVIRVLVYPGTSRHCSKGDESKIGICDFAPCEQVRLRSVIARSGSYATLMV